MTAVLRRTTHATVGVIVVLLLTAMVVVAFRGLDEDVLTSPAPAGEDGAGSDDVAPGADPVPGLEGTPVAPGATWDAADDLALVSQDVTLSEVGSPSHPATTVSSTTPAPRPTTSTPPVTTPPATTPPVVTPPPTTPPPVTPPVTPPPVTPPPAPAPTSVVNVSVLSGGNLVSVSVNPGGSNLLNLNLLQP
ncbi:hypothetical protein [Aeromicrobium sp. Leaf350]|uniref:hypothetical protein n=1 Tax=Aeromicrobium sp. Leaf350 TaxID=2876565 RepID=UPI001E2A59D9|nr:hypothetical protein [Aeromicrobium sp. Leaf350]